MWHRALVAIGWRQCSEGEPLLGRPQPSPLSLGLSLDRSRLHLLYRAPPAATWDDITAQVALELTHLYARFQVTHFSWSVSPPASSAPPCPAPCVQLPLIPSPQVLAVVHHQDLCGAPGGQGLAAAASPPCQPHRTAETPGPRADPAAVPAPQQGGAKPWAGGWAGSAQCRLLARGCPQVDATLRRLLERYRGPEPSDTVEMFEGERFFAAFERGIDVDAGRPPPLEGGPGQHQAPR